MSEYKERKYRQLFTSHGRSSFTVEHKQSDLWVAVDQGSWDDRIPAFCMAQLSAIWGQMESYMASHREYLTSLTPCPAMSDAPEILHRMSSAALKAGIGPMSAVAGAVGEYIAVSVTERFDCREIIVENGGDIYACFSSPLDVSVFAGNSPLSEKVGLHIPAEYSPLGICTSSGTVGPSLSFGKADAVMIISRETALADSYATAFANEITTADDIDSVIKDISSKEDILGAIIIKDDKMGITGEFDLRLFG